MERKERASQSLLYKIPRVVVGENVTFQGPEEYVRSQGVQVEILNDPTCVQLMRDLIQRGRSFGMRISGCEQSPACFSSPMI